MVEKFGMIEILNILNIFVFLNDFLIIFIKLLDYEIVLNWSRIVDGVICMYILIYWYNVKKWIMLECVIMIYIEGLME